MGFDAKRFAGLLRATVKSITRAPLEWRPAQWSLALAAAAGLAIACDQKRWIQELLRGHERGGPFEALARAATALGEGWVVTLIGFSLLAAGIGTRRPKVVDAAMVLGAAGILGWLAMTAVQLVAAESRPIDGGAIHWFARGGHSVSGHATSAALLLGPVRVLTAGARPGRRACAAAIAIGWALLVGWSRVWLDMHFLWNVGAGLLLGWSLAAAAFAAWRRELPVAAH